MLFRFNITISDTTTLIACDTVGGVEMENAHKQIIQRDIRGACHGDEIHRAFAVAQPAEDGADDVIRRDKRDADETDREVGDRAVYGFRWRGHNGNDRANHNQKNHGHRDRYRHEQRYGVSDILRRLLSISRADRLTDADGRAHRKADDHHRQHVHDLRSDGNGGGAGDALKLTDDEQIRHAVERLQKI